MGFTQTPVHSEVSARYCSTLFAMVVAASAAAVFLCSCCIVDVVNVLSYVLYFVSPDFSLFSSIWVVWLRCRFCVDSAMLTLPSSMLFFFVGAKPRGEGLGERFDSLPTCPQLP